jgi:hypothetical protein
MLLLLLVEPQMTQMTQISGFHPQISGSHLWMFISRWSVRVSQAFLRDDAEGEMPRRNYGLPERDDPEFERIAARALLEAACVNETQLAERATGFYWGEPRLRPFVEEMLVEAERAKNDRLEQVARRYLR